MDVYGCAASYAVLVSHNARTCQIVLLHELRRIDALPAVSRLYILPQAAGRYRSYGFDPYVGIDALGHAFNGIQRACGGRGTGPASTLIMNLEYIILQTENL